MAGSGLGGALGSIGGYGLANVGTTVALSLTGGPSLDGAIPGGFMNTLATPSAAPRTSGTTGASPQAIGQNKPLGPSVRAVGRFADKIQTRGPGPNAAPNGAYTGADLQSRVDVKWKISHGQTVVSLDFASHPTRIYTEYGANASPGMPYKGFPSATLGEHEMMHAWMTRGFFTTQNLLNIARFGGVQTTFTVQGPFDATQIARRAEAYRVAIASYFAAMNNFQQALILHPGTEGALPIFKAP